jgi:ubiquinone/menaquinone biosynthesis C-methylase UbiE
MKLMGVVIPELNAQAARVLDMGCGQGWAVLDAAEQGAQAYGLDLSAALIEKAHQHRNQKPYGHSPFFLVGASEKIPFKDDGFDVIVCTEIIEHTPRTHELLNEVRRLLRPGGWLLLSFPVKRVENFIAFFDANFMAYSGHVKQFTLKEAAGLLTQKGFGIIRKQARHFEWAVYWLGMAVFKQIPSLDRRGEQYGATSDEEKKWESFTDFYKRVWRKLRALKIGIPILWIGNFLFPKSYFLLCRKNQVSGE